MIRLYRLFTLIILFSAVLLNPLFGGGESIVVQLRLYEGFKQKGKVSAVVVSSYYLKKLAKEHILSDTWIDKEKKSLQKIYNLERVENISIIDMALKKGGENIQDILLGGRELAVKLSMFPREDDRFKVFVHEKGKKAALMETEVIIPQEKTAVLGFEDATKRIFFFSFHREKDTPAGVEDKRIASIMKPRLIKKVVPVYPEKLVEEGIEGVVRIRAEMDESGKVCQLQVEKSLHPLLDKTAVAAVKQWRYKPLMINGVPRPTDVIVEILFKIKDIPQRDE